MKRASVAVSGARLSIRFNIISLAMQWRESMISRSLTAHLEPAAAWMIAFLVSAFSLFACGAEPTRDAVFYSTPIDPTKIPQHIDIQIQGRRFESIGWLDEDTLVVTSVDVLVETLQPGDEIPADPFSRLPQIETIGLDGAIESIERLTRSPLSGHDCSPVNEDDVTRDKLRSFYFSRGCNYPAASGPPIDKTAVMYLHVDTEELRLIQEFPQSKTLNTFAIEPDGGRLATTVSAGFASNELYVFVPVSNAEFDPEAMNAISFLGDYRLIRGLDWSGRGLTVSAEGKGQDSETDSDEIINARADLLLIDPDSGSVSVLVHEAEEIAGMRWSPDESVLAFGGRIDGEDGTWIFDPESGDLILIWPEIAPFDWSPSGDRIAILHAPSLYGESTERVDKDPGPRNYPVIINVRS